MDYNEEWNRRLVASRTRENYYDDNDRARAYSSSDTIRLDGEMRVQLFEAQHDWTALDIGSGPGTLTIPLARSMKQVTAVEPSEVMKECLLEHTKEEKINNINIIHAKWEDVDIHELGTYDLVIASYSLFMMNIKNALLKMNQVARRKVFLFWFAGVTYWEQINLDLYPLVKKEEYIPFPKCDVIYNVLYESGIYPDVFVLNDTCFHWEFTDMDLAIKDLKKRLDITTDSYNNILAKYIIEHYISKGNKLIFKDTTKYIQMSWEPIAGIPND
jgi:SAM-dependent methyltransferase